MYYARRGTKDFFKYLEIKNMEFSDFVTLPSDAKEKVLLKFKWGSSVHEHNVECEITRKMLVSQSKNAEDNNPSWQSILKDEAYFEDLKKQIGLTPHGIVDPEIEKIGTLVGYKKKWQE